MLGRLKERLSPKKTAKRQEKRHRRAMQFEMLERRILPSAGGIIASQMAKQMADAHSAPPAHVRWDSTVDQQTRTSAASTPNGGTGSQWASSRLHLNMAQAQQAWSARQAAGPMSKPAAGSLGPTTSAETARAQLDASSQKTVQQIVFVDPSVTDYTQLIQDIVRGNAGSQGQQARSFNSGTWSEQAGLVHKGFDSNKATTFDDNGTLVVVLNGNEDGIDQITQVLSQYRNVSAVYILSHGAQGLVTLGTSVFDAQSLQSRLGEISGWSSSLAPGADILLYGCDVAEGQAGINFVNDLSAATGPWLQPRQTDGRRRRRRLDPRVLDGRRKRRAAVFSHIRGRVRLSAPGLYSLVREPERDPDRHERERYLRFFKWLGECHRYRHGNGRDEHPRFSAVTSNLTFTFHTDGTVSVTDAAGDTLNNVANMQKIIGGSGNNTYVFAMARLLPERSSAGPEARTLSIIPPTTQT